MKVAADSGPLISLASISLFDLLRSLFHSIHIPQAVYQEVVVAGKGRVGSEEVAGVAWIERHIVKNQRDGGKFNMDDGLSTVRITETELARRSPCGSGQGPARR